MTTPPVIRHAIGLLDIHRQTQPTSMSDTVDWINDARQAMETAADLIEALVLELNTIKHHEEIGELILDRLLPLIATHLQHLTDCDRDLYEYPDVTWMAGGCKACETLSLIHHYFDHATPILTDRDIDHVIPNPNYL